jgi:Protein of unknown function (DUF2849)
MTSPLQQKLKVAGPVVVTGNRLLDGAVVYRSDDGGWSADLAAATVVTTAAAASTMLAAALADKLEVIDAYVAPVKLSADRQVLPGNLREQIRCNGPTIPLPVSSLQPPASEDVDARDKRRHDEASSWPDLFRPSTPSPQAG